MITNGTAVLQISSAKTRSKNGGLELAVAVVLLTGAGLLQSLWDRWVPSI
jgi:hypothetical protein